MRFKPKNPLHKNEYEVRNIGLSVCLDLVQRLHYAKGGSNTGTYCHGLFRKDDALNCIGCAWWIPPTKSCAIASYPEGDWRRVLVLSRLVVEPSVPTNAASFILARTVRLIEADNHFEYLLTYADLSQGHTGAIYRAAGWEYLGITKPQQVWVTTDGRMVAKKCGPKTRTTSEMIALGYARLTDSPKHKFAKILPRSRKHQLSLIA